MSDKEPQGIHKEVPNLPDGETVYFKDDVLSPGHDSRYDAPYAPADTFIIGKNGPELEAHGGACRVLALYEPNNKTGALVHIDAADVYSDRHEELIGQLLDSYPSIATPATQGYLFGDIGTSAIGDLSMGDLKGLGFNISEEDGKNYTESEREWQSNIINYLRERRINTITEFTQGSGKDVFLDTKNGVIKVLDDRRKPIYNSRVTPQIKK